MQAMQDLAMGVNPESVLEHAHRIFSSKLHDALAYPLPQEALSVQSGISLALYFF